MRRPAAAASRRCFAKLPAGSVSPGEELRRARGVLKRSRSAAFRPRSCQRAPRVSHWAATPLTLDRINTSKMTQFERFHGADLIFKGDHVCYFCVFFLRARFLCFFCFNFPGCCYMVEMQGCQFCEHLSTFQLPSGRTLLLSC